MYTWEPPEPFRTWVVKLRRGYRRICTCFFGTLAGGCKRPLIFVDPEGELFGPVSDFRVLCDHCSTRNARLMHGTVLSRNSRKRWHSGSPMQPDQMPLHTCACIHTEPGFPGKPSNGHAGKKWHLRSKAVFFRVFCFFTRSLSINWELVRNANSWGFSNLMKQKL